MLLAIQGNQSFTRAAIMGGKALAGDFSGDVQQAHDDSRFCFTASTLQERGSGLPIYSGDALYERGGALTQFVIGGKCDHAI